MKIDNQKGTKHHWYETRARFRTIASIALTALIFALVADALDPAPSEVQTNQLALTAAMDNQQCSLPDVDDDDDNPLVVDLLNDYSDGASSRVYLKEEKSEEPLIVRLIGLSRRQTRARAPPQSGIDDRPDSPCLISSLTSSLWEPAHASTNFHQRFSTVQSRQRLSI